jgi:hypothetical protein
MVLFLTDAARTGFFLCEVGVCCWAGSAPSRMESTAESIQITITTSEKLRPVDFIFIFHPNIMSNAKIVSFLVHPEPVGRFAKLRS